MTVLCDSRLRVLVCGLLLIGPLRASSEPAPLTLAGNGIATTLMSGCVASTAPDFIEAPDVWTPLRLTPRDCALVGTATPVFAWSQPANRDLRKPWTWTLRDERGALIISRSSPVPRTLMAPGKLLPGRYHWTASYVDKAGKTLTSQARRFEVQEGAINVLLPSAAAVVQAASAKPHPRLLPAGVGFARIQALAMGSELKVSFQAFSQRADTALAYAPRPEPLPQGQAGGLNIQSAQAGSSLTQTAWDERRDLQALAYFGRFKDDKRYTRAAIERLMALAGWNPNGATSETKQDQANREVYLALAEGLDLLSDQLSMEQTALINQAIKARIRQAMANFPGMDTLPYNSHLVASTGFIVEALLYTVGTPGFPEAESWLAQAYELWIADQDVWGGYDGGFANSTAYGWFVLAALPHQLSALKLSTGFDIAGWQPIARLGDQYIAMAPPMDGLRGPFGDGAETLDNYSAHAFDGYRMLAGLTRDPAQEWYWRQLPANVATRYPLPPAHYMLLAIKASRPLSAAPAQNSFVFEDAGLVALHSRTADPARSSVYFRSSSLGSMSHAHADNNAFTLVSRGRDLLISAGYYPFYNSRHHASVGRATRFKNALTFDGGIGQAEPVRSPVVPGAPVIATEARGRLLNFFDDGTWAVSTGDATLAYRGRDPATLVWSPLLSNAVRSLAYNRKERVLVVYDWATSAKPRSWELNFQALQLPTLSGKTVKVVNGGATACIDVYGLDGNFSLASGFPVAPENGKPDHHRAIYKSSASSMQLTAVTVIREDCRDLAVSVAVDGANASVSLNKGRPLILDQRRITLYADTPPPSSKSIRVRSS